MCGRYVVKNPVTKTSNFKYNKTKYYWYLDGYIYLPNVTWEGVRVQAIFDDDISGLNCAEDARECVLEQDRELNVPDHLFSEIEQMVLQEILMAGQVPSDGADDSQNVLR